MLWAEGPLTIREAHEGFGAYGKPVSYPTMQTRLNRLAEKGLVSRSEDRPARYRAAVSRDQVTVGHLRELVAKISRRRRRPARRPAAQRADVDRRADRPAQGAAGGGPAEVTGHNDPNGGSHDSRLGVDRRRAVACLGSACRSRPWWSRRASACCVSRAPRAEQWAWLFVLAQGVILVPGGHPGPLGILGARDGAASATDPP